MQYSDWVATIANLTVNDPTDTNFIQILPEMIDYAEGRCYRDLDLVSTIAVNSSGTVLTNTRDLTLPTPSQGIYDTIDQINLLQSGVRTPLTEVSREVLDMLWPGTTTSNTSQVPTQFAVTSTDSNGNFIVSFGPLAGANVSIEVLGHVKPAPLSATNTSTYLTNIFPDLFVAASMIFASGWQKNFGAQADDPRMGQSWEMQYQALIKNADQYGARQKFAGASWSPKRAESYAIPQRG